MSDRPSYQLRIESAGPTTQGTRILDAKTNEDLGLAIKRIALVGALDDVWRVHVDLLVLEGLELHLEDAQVTFEASRLTRERLELLLEEAASHAVRMFRGHFDQTKLADLVGVDPDELAGWATEAVDRAARLAGGRAQLDDGGGA